MTKLFFFAILNDFFLCMILNITFRVILARLQLDVFVSNHWISTKLPTKWRLYFPFIGIIWKIKWFWGLSFPLLSFGTNKFYNHWQITNPRSSDISENLRTGPFTWNFKQTDVFCKILSRQFKRKFSKIKMYEIVKQAIPFNVIYEFRLFR